MNMEEKVCLIVTDSEKCIQVSGLRLPKERYYRLLRIFIKIGHDSKFFTNFALFVKTYAWLIFQQIITYL